MAAKPLPSKEELRRLFHYDAERGLLIWKPRKDKSWKCSLDNTVAGRVTALGYVVVKIAMRQHMAHRVIWTMHHGEIPPRTDVDHRDGDKLNNRLDNLRLATRAQNAMNARVIKPTRSGVKGVSIDPDYGYITAICAGVRLGTYDTIEEARAAYANEARRRFGEFARVL